MNRERSQEVLSEDPLDQINRLRAEHQALERRLEELDTLVYLTPDEQLERKRIQKTKLQKKDLMQALQRKLTS
ncbi:MAG: hypothetical protein JW797_18045 [Bradymonadales bacterium]|nr:hypothetical protein [Bradymonadales bacterium]